MKNYEDIWDAIKSGSLPAPSGNDSLPDNAENKTVEEKAKQENQKLIWNVDKDECNNRF